MSALLGLVALVAALLVFGRAIASKRRADQLPGARPASAIAVSDFGEIDAHVLARRCVCDGRYTSLGEGPVAGNDQLRLVRLECRDCEREALLYFDVSGTRVLH